MSTIIKRAGAYLLPLLLLSVLATSLIVSISSHADDDELVVWNQYAGEIFPNGDIPGYTVIISESEKSSGKVERIVHLYPIDESEVGQTWVGRITGYDFDGELLLHRDWELIFRCGFPDSANGCNSVIIAEGFGDRWNPCSADAENETLEQSFREALPLARRMLAVAVAQIYNEGHLVRTLESVRADTGPEERG